MLTHGIVHLIEPTELSALLAKGHPLRIKAGFDPTAPDLHLGHVVLLKKLREFQDQGHTVVMIVGTTTATIGDPTGRNKLRPPLSEDQAIANGWTYMSQAFKILDKSRTVVRKNSEWFSEFSMDDMIRLMSNFTLSQMMVRDDFRKRWDADQPIHLHELTYPLLQAYDSFKEGVDIEFGGTDQLINMMMGREYMRLRGMTPQVVATVPLLPGIGGGEKMSKSLGNHIPVNDPPFQMFSKVMSISDDLMYFTWREIFFPNRPRRDTPMEDKKHLAWAITELLHDTDAATAAMEEWENVFTKRSVPADLTTTVVDVFSLGLRLDKLLYTTGLAESVSAGGRLIRQGAVKIDGVVCDNFKVEPLQHGESLTIQVGRRWIKIIQK